MSFLNPQAKFIPSILIFTTFLSSVNAQKTETPPDLINSIFEKAKKLVYVPDPKFGESDKIEGNPEDLKDLGFEQVYENTKQSFQMRDGIKLNAFVYAKESNLTVILLHGILSSAYMMNKTAGLLRNSLQAEVIALDLRGHGQSGGRPGDIDYPDQLTDDIADVISIIRKSKPNRKIILAGHSLGGGIAITYAQRHGMPNVEGYVLFAPHLGHNAPTLPSENLPKSNNVGSSFLKIHIWRILGIKLLHTFDDHSYDSLPVLFFNVPEFMPVKNYSFRFNQGSVPEDYREGLQAINKPLLVLVGSRDEAFTASEFENAVKKYSRGDICIIKGATHNGVRHSEEAHNKIREWTKRNKLIPLN